MYDPFIPAAQLKQGDTFKVNPRQSKEYWVQGLEIQTGKLTITTGQSKKIELDPDQKVFLISSPLSQSSKTELL